MSWFTKLFKRENMKPMIDDATVIERLTLNEGCRLKSYYDSKHKLTIGIGHNLDDNPLTKEELCYIGHDCRSKFISNDQAIYLCKNDIKKVRADLDRELPWWHDLTVDRQFVLIDMCFNLGIGKKGGVKGLLGFKNTLNYLARGYYEQAAKNILQSKYANDVGIRAKRNAHAIKTGVWVPKPPKEII